MPRTDIDYRGAAGALLPERRWSARCGGGRGRGGGQPRASELHRLAPNSGPVVDGEVEFKNFNDLILYLPRALAVGLWAPFPKDWFSAGRMVGRAGRLLSGAETLVIYLCELLALVCVWREPRRLAAWLLLLITTSGVTALALVVSNVGALYRFRYLFWMLLIILGVKGFESVVTAVKAGKLKEAGG